jgi:hypothetical protein
MAVRMQDEWQGANGESQKVVLTFDVAGVVRRGALVRRPLYTLARGYPGGGVPGGAVSRCWCGCGLCDGPEGGAG